MMITSRNAVIGTRVALIAARAGEGTGVIVAVRPEPWLRPFVVELDSGRTVYVSAAHVAREADPKKTPLGPSLHDD